MRTRTTQEITVIDHLLNYGEITSWEAFEKYGITRLSAVIYNIKKRGYKLQTRLECKTNRYGNNVNYAVYKLKSIKVEGEEKNEDSIG